ncbi:MAG: hypothetical protein Q7R98_00315 [Candidatus Jorgensenbacteria bacterium]|nr:hypothetical protein [Candidatus Jorgensenbacteria bacterium]
MGLGISRFLGNLSGVGDSQIFAGTSQSNFSAFIKFATGVGRMKKSKKNPWGGITKVSQNIRPPVTRYKGNKVI